MGNERVTRVAETNLGLYVWKMPNGKIMGDDEGNYLRIPAQRGDKQRIANITYTAHSILKSNGFPEEGEPYFLPGARSITDEEHAEQKDRLKSGLIPDKYDIASMQETLAAEKKFKK